MTSWRNVSTTRSFALTLPAPPRIAVAAWVGCVGAAVAALAVTPATASPAARATATATRCNFLMTSSFILGFETLDLIVQVDIKIHHNLMSQVILWRPRVSARARGIRQLATLSKKPPNARVQL